MKSPAQDLATLLVNAGVGVLGADSGWSINISWLPEQPDTTIVLYDMPGGEFMDDDLDLFKSVVQIRTAARDYGIAYTKAWDIQQYLLTVTGTVVAGNTYLAVNADDAPTAAGKTDTDLFPFTQNFTVMRQTT